MQEGLNSKELQVTVDALILTACAGELRILLSRRPHPPYECLWALPGRFISPGESADAAVAGLLEEMLPVGQYYSEQLYTFTDPQRDPRGRVLSVAYLVIIPWRCLQGALDSSGVTLTSFSVRMEEGSVLLTDEDGARLPLDELAFDHAAMIRTGVLRLQGKIDYTDIGFRFLNDPGAFSLSELQSIFEAILGKRQDASNFRRFVRNRYEETGKIVSAAVTQRKGKGRPAQLYKWMEPKEESK